METAVETDTNRERERGRTARQTETAIERQTQRGPERGITDRSQMETE